LVASRSVILAAMHAEDVELVHQLVDAVARQDLEALLQLTDPDVVFQSYFAQVTEGGVYRGHDGIKQYVADLAETAEVLQSVIDDILRVGATIIAVGRLTYRGKGSGVETETPIGYFLRVRDGRLFRLRAFRDPEETLASLGPSPA
jgi:ketosteroid isomerase-like protein